MTHQLKIGQPAPAFILPDGNQNNHSLSDYRGSWLVLFFYPKDLTPGCTAEACQFRDHYADIQANNSQILGINTDNSASHKHFIEKNSCLFRCFPILTEKHAGLTVAYSNWVRSNSANATLLLSTQMATLQKFIARYLRTSTPDKLSTI
nr:peroxiredoxin [Methylomarinum sp. Ch1-1]MDP4521272.1 peroxiredoxin [Methylomarinum sp. Ch1-1]